MPEEEERERLGQAIRQWNSSRLGLFEISPPDESLEFHGVMRFYFEDRDGGSVATKCLRVRSSSSTREVIRTLSEKFRPEAKGKYSLFETREDKDRPAERKLGLEERPLAVQLKWTEDDREGRFVLKTDKDSLETKEDCQGKDKGGVIQTFKRTLSRKEKKNKNKAADKESEDETETTEEPPSSVCDAPLSPTCGEQEEQRSPGGPRPDASPRLPIQVNFHDEAEDAVLSAVIGHASGSPAHFGLCPAYVLYAVARSALQRARGPGVAGRPHAATRIADKTVAAIRKVVQGQQAAAAAATAFWMANSSELLNFLERDKDLGPLTGRSRLDLCQLVHAAYSGLLRSLRNELRLHLPAFLGDPEQRGPPPAGAEMVLSTLMSFMSLLRRCRVNPALTIQLFSQLFHFISSWLFNQLVTLQAGAPGPPRSRSRGAALRQRLAALQAWAERQGLELAADCHLGHIIQATSVLTMNKYSVQDVEDIRSSCFRLNSLQLRALLAGYVYAADEPRIPPELIEAVVAAAEASADGLIRSEGRAVRLEESLDLQLPFLLPDGGFSCSSTRGIPPGLLEFLEPVCQTGLCSLTVQTSSEGIWTVHFAESTSARRAAAPTEPEVVAVTLNKPLNSGMGISIVAAKGAGQDNLGIYIKSVVEGGPAERNGRLTAGDQMLSVDGKSLVGISQERAASIMMKTGTVVTLKVAKFAAECHGLGSLLGQHASEQNSSGEGCANPKSTALSPVNPWPSEHLHGNSRRKKEQLMQRNRQLYRSNPNITECFQDRNDFDLGGKSISAVSSLNLCSDTFHREYLTLPALKSQGKSEPKSSQTHQTSTLLDLQSSTKRSSMRQAMSQENLYVDKSPISWEQSDRCGKQTLSYESPFPIRSSCSAHNIPSDGSSPTKQPRASRPSPAGVWRTPLSQHPAPSSQPIRIDIPLTRAVRAQTARTNQNLRLLAPPNPDRHAYACPVPAHKHQPRGSAQEGGLTPTKHVSFQDPPGQQRPPEQGSGPWRRRGWGGDARDEPEEQRQLREVELLQQEVQRLRAKEERTLEENDRLRRLGLEWHFQKRLQERRGREEEEEEEEDVALLMTQQLERRTQMVRSSAAEKQPRPRLCQADNRGRTEQSGANHVNGAAPKEIPVSTPEKLTFRECQSLFSLVSSAEVKVKAS